MMQAKAIKIRPIANHHGMFLMVLALIMFSLIWVLIDIFIPEHRLMQIGLYLICGVIFITGLLKKIQPKHSFVLTKTTLGYYHSVGTWLLPWVCIKYIAPVSSTHGIEQQSLPYIGIRLHEIEKLSDLIPVRLANKLLHEQKPLLIWAINHELITFEQSIINFSSYKLSDNREIKGPLAAFLYQVDVLEQAFGFHLYLPSSSFDRDIADFCQLLKQCQSHATA